jgi:hypothetical protein
VLQPTFPTGFIAPCLPTKTDALPSGGLAEDEEPECTGRDA